VWGGEESRFSRPTKQRRTTAPPVSDEVAPFGRGTAESGQRDREDDGVALKDPDWSFPAKLIRKPVDVEEIKRPLEAKYSLMARKTQCEEAMARYAGLVH
jgi:hypothetical protein